MRVHLESMLKLSQKINSFMISLEVLRLTEKALKEKMIF